MKRLFKKNQIIITTLAVMIAIAGYLSLIHIFSGARRAWGRQLLPVSLQDRRKQDLLISALLQVGLKKSKMSCAGQRRAGV